MKVRDLIRKAVKKEAEITKLARAILSDITERKPLPDYRVEQRLKDLKRDAEKLAREYDKDPAEVFDDAIDCLLLNIVFEEDDDEYEMLKEATLMGIEDRYRDELGLPPKHEYFIFNGS